MDFGTPSPGRGRRAERNRRRGVWTRWCGFRPATRGSPPGRGNTLSPSPPSRSPPKSGGAASAMDTETSTRAPLKPAGYQGPSGIEESALPAAADGVVPGEALPQGARPEVRDKFIFVGDRKLYVRGITYGAFRPDEQGNEYSDLDVIDRDFEQMAANGIN